MIGGGERGIRTLGTVSRTHAFQACAFNHSATSPHWNGRNIHKIILRSSIVTGSEQDDRSEDCRGSSSARPGAGSAGVVEDQAHAFLKVSDKQKQIRCALLDALDAMERSWLARSALAKLDATILLDGCLLNRVHLAFQPRQFSRRLAIALEGEQGWPEQHDCNTGQHCITCAILVLLASNPGSMAGNTLSLGHKLWTGIMLVLNRRYV